MLLVTFYLHVLNWLQNLTVCFIYIIYIYIYVYLNFFIHFLFKRIQLLIMQQMSQNSHFMHLMSFYTKVQIFNFLTLSPYFKFPHFHFLPMSVTRSAFLLIYKACWFLEIIVISLSRRRVERHFRSICHPYFKHNYGRKYNIKPVHGSHHVVI